MLSFGSPDHLGVQFVLCGARAQIVNAIYLSFRSHKYLMLAKIYDTNCILRVRWCEVSRILRQNSHAQQNEQQNVDGRDMAGFDVSNLKNKTVV